MNAPDLHPDIGELARLLGTWTGGGDGEYPTIQPFGYTEQVEFGHVGKPFVSYVQRTRAADDGRPLHSEMGYLRPAGPGRVEWVVAIPTGHSESGVGQWRLEGDILVIDIDASVVATPNAKPVSGLQRRFRVTGDTLEYTLAMEAVGQPMTQHLAATLRRA